MALPKYAPPVASKAGRVALAIFTEMQTDGTVGPLGGHLGFTLLDATGETVHSGEVDVSELTATQRTGLTNLLTTIRTRINGEAL